MSDRERLIAAASWWSGWCTDHDGTLPELAKLGGFLLDVKHRMALDRDMDAARSSSSKGDES